MIRLYLVCLLTFIYSCTSNINSVEFDKEKKVGLQFLYEFFSSIKSQKTTEINDYFTDEFISEMGEFGARNILQTVNNEVGDFVKGELMSILIEGKGESVGYIHITLLNNYSDGVTTENFILQRKDKELRIKSYIVSIKSVFQ